MQNLSISLRYFDVDSMYSPFTEEIQEFPKRGRVKDATNQSKIKRMEIFGKRRGTGKDT